VTKRTKILLETLNPEDEFLYQALEENVQYCRETLLMQGFSREERIILLGVLNQCKDLQLKLAARLQSTEDTADFDIKGFNK
jgi:hypothetical protein